MKVLWVIDSLATALLLHGLVQLGDGLVEVERFDRHWLLAHRIEAPQQGQAPITIAIAIGKVLRSDGL